MRSSSSYCIPAKLPYQLARLFLFIFPTGYKRIQDDGDAAESRVNVSKAEKTDDEQTNSCVKAGTCQLCR